MFKTCVACIVHIVVCIVVQDTVDVVRNGMPSKTFSEMMSVLRKFVSFMNLTVCDDTAPCQQVDLFVYVYIKVTGYT